MSLARAAAIVAEMRAGVAFTGAGVSTESGIPDFRSPGGIWSKYDPDEFAFPRFVSSAEARKKYWAFGLEMYPHVAAAQPNPGHHALAELEKRGKLRCVITQNIDGLHTDAGLSAELVCEVHGTGRQFVCLACGERGPMGEAVARVEAGEEDPACLACGGIIKAATVSFGQNIPSEVWARAEALTGDCDAFVAVGSSLVVQPAAGLPRRASRLGASLVIVNREPTPLDHMADVVLHGEAGNLLPALVDAALGAAPR